MIQVHQVAWGPEGVTIAYSTDDAVRDLSGSPVVQTHQLILPPEPAYFERSEVYMAAQDWVRDLVNAYGMAQPWEEPVEPEDDDDDEDRRD